MSIIFSKPRAFRRASPLKTGQTTQYGGYKDDGYYQTGLAARYKLLTSGQYAGSVNITLNSKTDTHLNACVLDEITGLFWSRTPSAGVGPASGGGLPWTTNGSGEGIFSYVDAANAANLAGYSDWRVPNRNELLTLLPEEVGATFDPTAFPSMGSSALYFWTSTTKKNNTANANAVSPDAGTGNLVKTTEAKVLLVRG